jgi:mRNA interferase MazF
MREAQIILADLPIVGQGWKRRPALVLRQLPGYGDYLVCGLSSQLHQLVPGFGERLNPDPTNGLMMPSIVRLEYLFVVA